MSWYWSHDKIANCISDRPKGEKQESGDFLSPPLRAEIAVGPLAAWSACVTLPRLGKACWIWLTNHCGTANGFKTLPARVGLVKAYRALVLGSQFQQHLHLFNPAFPHFFIVMGSDVKPHPIRPIDVKPPLIYSTAVKPSIPIKSRKRAFEDNDDIKEPAIKHPCLQPEPLLPTPSPTASPKPAQRSKARKQPGRASPQPEPKPSKRAFATDQQIDRPVNRQTDDDPDCDLAPSRKRRRQSSTEPESKRLPKSSSEPASKRRRQSSSSTWFLDDWLETSAQDEAKGSVEIFSTIERPSFPQILVPGSHASSDIDQMSQRDGETPAPGSTASALSERLNTSSPLYRGTLRMNDIVVDDFGEMIPRDVQELVTKHIRKERKSPKLEDDQHATIKETIKEGWDSSEPMVSDIIKPPLFPVKDPYISEGRDTLWSTQPLPRNPDYTYALPAPKTDRHFGFHPTRKSGWTPQELSAADHPKVRPYSQPTRENLFPLFLMELKSESTGGTLYGAEGQLATSGAHRVNSLIWTLDQVDPSRSRSSADALVFSAAVSQRQAIAHVHYYNLENGKFYMSWIDTFSFAKDVQACCDYTKNVVEWMLQVQQPIVRDALAKLHPMVKVWKKGRSASAITDATEAFTSEDGRLTKSRRTSED
ncbi:MAG: hypothetical protein M1816_001210 [Peltula sp. TS41687]|nr:MAG: hypothetical protein M1816_001210 [Peltula sp. TS41687]